MDWLTIVMGEIFSQCICTPNLHVVHFRYHSFIHQLNLNKAKNILSFQKKKQKGGKCLPYIEHPHRPPIESNPNADWRPVQEILVHSGARSQSFTKQGMGKARNGWKVLPGRWTMANRATLTNILGRGLVSTNWDLFNMP